MAEAPATPRTLSNIVIAGPGYAPEYQGADERITIPFAVAMLREGGRAFELEGSTGRFDLTGQDGIAGFDAGPAFNLQFPRIDVEDPRIAALDEVDVAVELGAFARYVIEPGWAEKDALATRVSATADVAGAHDGALVEFESEYAWFPLFNVRVSLGARASWASDNFVDTYFGVDGAGSGASGLGRYDPGAGLRSVGAQASAAVFLSETRGVFAFGRYDRLAPDLADSPVVRDAGSADQLLIGVGLIWRF